jgi:hypothetical protein
LRHRQRPSAGLKRLFRTVVGEAAAAQKALFAEVAIV